ncbi:RHTO0S14e04016g1_1 [Rhodotorula toruloides]|uniref:RHTO0S14e04016g1_1 n=2 Tax=Rhodotorula toruloides TaxID=5286 RepID=A0A061BBZ2_RHOTO|nr:RHTO0S14e04016g1_1 [Rhodotorula toruloides]
MHLRIQLRLQKVISLSLCTLLVKLLARRDLASSFSPSLSIKSSSRLFCKPTTPHTCFRDVARAYSC